MHVLPQLRRLEQRYPTELAVIGVHTPKFPAERETEALRHAVLRYDIRHPVVNDRDFAVWSQYACRAWPTLYLIDSQGMVIGRHEGEIHGDDFDRIIGEIVTESDAHGLMDRTPLPYAVPLAPDSPMRFPGKVLADEASKSLFIADSAHHRLLLATLDGQIRQVIGDGTPGLEDGPLTGARFQNPQGMALAGEILYVADTENHAIRRVDLARGIVETVAGTGAQALSARQSGPALSTPLSSPWDLALHNGRLFIAMAGLHQLWALDLDSGRVYPYAGSGREEILDGPLASACLAQPSGLTLGDETLYVADSETSAIRAVAPVLSLAEGLDIAGRVTTLVGHGLFDFGDRDGVAEAARLQHPLGLAWHRGLLYVADSYNNKVKCLDPRTRSVLSFLGDGTPGFQDGPGPQARFHEPAGLSIAAGRLYVADTNNHAIRLADLASGRVETLEMRE